MIKKLSRALILACITILATVSSSTFADGKASRATIIYDALVGKQHDVFLGWGYSVLVEHGGKRILFDTGGQYGGFAANTKKLGIDLKSLDFVVLTHRHGDHTSGMAYVLQQNPKVKIYAPLETGSFGSPTSAPVVRLASRRVAETPEDLHYFDGDKATVDSPWPGANISQIDKPVEVLPGVFLFRTVSENKGTLELNELSMAIKTSKGLAVFVGCSHPGIEKILAAAAEIDPNIYSVFGGMHLTDATDQQVANIVENFKFKWKVDHVAPGHCTGEFAQSLFTKQFGPNHEHAGVGEVISLPQ